MSVTLATARASLRLALGDGSSTNWTDAQLDGAITRAVERYALALPRQLEASVTVSGRFLDLAAAPPAGIGSTAYADFIAAEELERTAASDRPRMLYRIAGPFAGKLTIDAGAGTPNWAATLRYTARHTIAESTGTIPDAHLPIVREIALGEAWLDYAQRRLDVVNIGGPAVSDTAIARGHYHAEKAEGMIQKARGTRTRELRRAEEPTFDEGHQWPI